MADIVRSGPAMLSLSKSLGGTARELEAGDDPTTSDKGDIMSDSSSSDTMRHRRHWATSWFVLAAAATAAAALAVPRYRRNHRGI